MNCSKYKQDILLMIHGELGFTDRVRLKAHISRCTECRDSVRQLTTASHMLGAAIRTPGMPAWKPASTPRPRRIPMGRAVVALVVIVGAGAVLTSMYVRGHRRSMATVTPVAISKCPTCCTPDLPNDKCK